MTVQYSSGSNLVTANVEAQQGAAVLEGWATMVVDGGVPTTIPVPTGITVTEHSNSLEFVGYTVD